MSGVKSAAAESFHSILVKEDASAWSFGRNYSGDCKDCTFADPDTEMTYNTKPVQVMSGVKSAAAGGQHSILVKEDASAWSFGHNYYGQLGDGTRVHRLKVEQVMSGVKSAAAGGLHSILVKEDASAWSFGRNIYGQLGDGTRSNYRLKTEQVMSGVKSAAAE